MSCFRGPVTTQVVFPLNKEAPWGLHFDSDNHINESNSKKKIKLSLQNDSQFPIEFYVDKNKPKLIIAPRSSEVIFDGVLADMVLINRTGKIDMEYSMITSLKNEVKATWKFSHDIDAPEEKIDIMLWMAHKGL